MVDDVLDLADKPSLNNVSTIGDNDENDDVHATDGYIGNETVGKPVVPMRKLNYKMRVISASGADMNNEEMKEDEIDDNDMDTIATMHGAMHVHEPSASNVSEMMYDDDELGMYNLKLNANVTTGGNSDAGTNGYVV